MWQNLLGQIQQKIDDAVELLDEDESDDDDEQHKEAADKHSSNSKDVVTTTTAAATVAASATDAAHTVADKDDDSTATEAATATPPLPQLTTSPSVASTHRADESSDIKHDAEATAVAPGAMQTTAADAHTSNTHDDNKDSALVPCAVGGGVAGDSATAASMMYINDDNTVEHVTSMAHKDDDKDKAADDGHSGGSVRVGSMTADDTADSPVATPIAAAPSSPPSTAQPRDTHSSSSSGSNGDVVNDNAATQSRAASSDETQLLRFQRQLAEEMAHVAVLQERVTALTRDRDVLTQQLTTLQARLQATSTASDDVAALIDALGKEKARNKALQSERAALRERVTALTAAADAHAAQAAQWHAEQAGRQHDEQAAQLHVARLEEDLTRYASQVQELRGQLTDAQRAREALRASLQHEQTTHRAALAQAAEAHAEVTAAAREEAARLCAALRAAAAEHDARVVALERELVEARTRAEEAEARLVDVEGTAATSLCALRVELDDRDAQCARLTCELQHAREAARRASEQLASVQQARAADAAAHAAALSVQQRAAAEAHAARERDAAALTRQLREATAAHEHDVAQLRAALAHDTQSMSIASAAPMAASVDTAVPTCDKSKSSGSSNDDSARQQHALARELTPLTRATSDVDAAQLPSTAQQQQQQQQQRRASVPTSETAVRTTSLLSPLSTAHVAATLAQFRANEPSSVLQRQKSSNSAHTHASYNSHSVLAGFAMSGYDSAVRARLEKELLRQSLELERLRGCEAEAAALRTQLRELTVKYDLLLQMYGQLEESTGGAATTPPPPLSPPRRDSDKPVARHIDAHALDVAAAAVAAAATASAEVSRASSPQPSPPLLMDSP